MATDLAFEAALDFGHILDVIDVAVSQEEQLRLGIARLEPIARALRRIEKNPAFGRGHEIAVRFENPAAKGFVNHLL